MISTQRYALVLWGGRGFDLRAEKTRSQPVLADVQGKMLACTIAAHRPDVFREAQVKMRHAVQSQPPKRHCAALRLLQCK